MSVMKYILLFDDITLCRESTVSFWRIERHFMCMLFSHIFCLLFNRHRMKYPDLYDLVILWVCNQWTYITLFTNSNKSLFVSKHNLLIINRDLIFKLQELSIQCAIICIQKEYVKLWMNCLYEQLINSKVHQIINWLLQNIMVM